MMEEIMRDVSPLPPDSKKPERRKGPVGLWLYGLLTILGGLALIVVTE
jgi:hypothetical protein